MLKSSYHQREHHFIKVEWKWEYLLESLSEAIEYARIGMVVRILECS